MQAEILKNYNLKAHNTFGIDVLAHAFAKIHSEQKLKKLISEASQEIKIIGGGSNILFTKDIDQLTVLNEIKGIKVVVENEEAVIVGVGAGENWHQFVLWALDNAYYGIENLSLIPGTVGAAPIQNIGAYGVELESVFVRLEALDLERSEKLVFDKKEAKFAYRDSLFKKELKGKICITKVYLRLLKKPKINISYGAIHQVLEENNIENPSPRDVSNAVIQIRKSKLPDPLEIGNAGSFFKNPEIDKNQFDSLQKEFPSIVHYPLPNYKVKIPAGWLIEKAGWKGKRFGNFGCHAKQALVLVNYGGASGQDIWNLALEIQHSVNEKFGIILSPEVNVW